MTAQPLRMFRATRRRLAAPLFCALVLAVAAGTAQAQPPPCQDGENRVDFPVGQISSYEVPEGVEALRVTVAAGQGGDTSFSLGGRGAVLTGTVAVRAGNELQVLVGTMADFGGGVDGGGGGGSFVGLGTTPETAFVAENLLVVAGGGGGAAQEAVGAGGAGGTPAGGDGTGPAPGRGGANGTGGDANNGAGQGGGRRRNGADGSGWFPSGAGGGGAGGNGGDSNATCCDTRAGGGMAAVHGGAGGAGDPNFGAGGGFGGGGGSGISAGGGGGYSGGGGGGEDDGRGNGNAGSGGGGSSFFRKEAVSNVEMAATNEGDGYVIVCEIRPAPELTFDPASLEFDDVIVGESRAFSTTLTNTGDADATGLSFAISGDGFEISSNSCQTTLAPGGGCALSIRFAPSAPGPVEGTLTVESAEDLSTTVALTGTGVAPSTWTISGTIAGETDTSVVAGVTVTLTGGSGGTQTTDDQGEYTFAGLAADEDYTVTPNLDGYTFTPQSQTFEDLSRNVTANFTAAAVPLTITGTVVDEEDAPLAGVTVALSGDSQAEVITGDDGAFAFEALTWGGSYIVTPTHPDYDVQPASRRFDPLDADQEITFTATLLTATYTRYFGEGAIGAFFDTTVALFNPSAETASATLSFAGETGEVVPHAVTIPAGQQVIVDPETLLPAEWVGFATAIEADQTLVTSRTMQWDDRHYGRHESAGVATPQPEWWFTEGATGTFQLFYLLYNPGDTAAEVTATYYRGGEQPPVTRTYTVAPHTRRTVFVNVAADGVTPDPELGETEVSAHIVSTNGVPIVAERALYLTTNAAQPLTAGTIAAAVTEPTTSWHFAEGATAFFDLFLLLANPSTAPVEATVRYLLPTGEPRLRTYTLAPESRRTIWVNQEDAALAETQVAISIQSDTPILAERAMWWGANGAWDGGHVSAGATRSATRWGLAGVTLGGPGSAEAYVLIANPNAADAEATLTLVTPDGPRAPITMPLGAWSRTTLRLADLFPDVDNERAAVLVESTGGDNPVPLVVEGAAYASPNDRPLTTGSATPALPLPE